jgi:MFS family permease
MPAAMFTGSFAWSFAFVSLPFYIQTLSTGDHATTLRWTGWILGISSLMTVVTGPLWGRLATVASPRMLWGLVELLQGLGFLLMAAARTLPELFLARLVLGAMGAASTFVYIIVGRGTDVRRRVATIQSAMTVGQVMGPLAGAVTATRMGFRPSFVLAGVILGGVSALVWLGVPRGSGPRGREVAAGRASVREVALVCLVVFSGSLQIFFLPAMLPRVLELMAVPAERALDVGGLIIFATGVAAAVGAVVAPRLGDVFGERRVLPLLLVASSLLLAALAIPSGPTGLGGVRFLQVVCVAPVFPLVVAGIATRASGQAIGVVNSARIGASFIGPVFATMLLSWAAPAAVYLSLAVLGLAVVPVVVRGLRAEPERGGAGA